MVININPNYIRPATNRPTRTDERRNPSSSRDEATAKPLRVEENFIPAPDSLATIIRNAIAALRQGITWDRGTILNLVV